MHKAEISISHIFKWRRFPYEAARSTYYLTVRDFKYIFKEKKNNPTLGMQGAVLLRHE